MPMDEYDTAHTTNYTNIINVYSNSDIDSIINNTASKLGNSPYMDQFTDTLRDQIDILRGSLKILDPRIVTCISSRVCCINNDNEGQWCFEWCLVNVWRGRN